MYKKVHSFAPATVANVACGFDVLGFAVNEPGDDVIVERIPESGVKIIEINGDNGKLPKEAEKNTASLAVMKFLEYIDSTQGVAIKLHKRMPLGSGMGSSAASSVAALVAVNALLGEPMKREQLLPFAMEGEKLACGSAHADNVAPALYGGFVLIRSYDPLDVIRISTPPKLWCTIIHPDVEVQTKNAREILRKDVKISDAIVQWGNVAGLIAGLMQNDYELIGRSLKDVLIEPVRSILIPGFNNMQAAALKAGALGCSISGSGPSVFALSTSKQKAKKIGKSMQSIVKNLGLESQVYVSPINQEGPKVISKQ